MGSGLKSIVISTAERAVSTDINRLQAFQTRGLMEALRFLLNVMPGTDDVQAGGFSTENLAQAAPLSGEVLGGLAVIPQNNTLQLGVTDGILLVINPDASPNTDDSPYKYIQDPGLVGSTGGLAMTANTTGSPRIDCVECAPIVNPVQEEDSRDIFNPTTGLFTATTISKTAGSILQYRVRAGTVGSGFPGVQQGWLPLAVALVPAGCTAVDTMTFWDVRPMVNDRIFGVSSTAQDLPRRTKLQYSLNQTGSGTAARANGVVETTLGSQGKLRYGGRLQRGSPGTDNFGYVDFADPANQEAGLAVPGATSQLIFFYLVTLFGLPRWARYTDFSSLSVLRFPRNPRGIPIASLVPPTHAYGQPSSPIVLPAAFGLNGASSSTGVCFGASTFLTPSGPGPGIIQGQATSDGWTNVSAPVFGATCTLTSNVGKGTLLENVHFPAGASKIRVRFGVLLTLTGTIDGQMVRFRPTFINGASDSVDAFTVNPTVFPNQVSVAYVDSQALNIGQPTGPSNVAVTWTFEVDLPDLYPDQVPQSYDVNYSFAEAIFSGGSLSFPSMWVTDWKMRG
jgi:hypothetical protein